MLSKSNTVPYVFFCFVLFCFICLFGFFCLIQRHCTKDKWKKDSNSKWRKSFRGGQGWFDVVWRWNSEKEEEKSNVIRLNYKRIRALTLRMTEITLSDMFLGNLNKPLTRCHKVTSLYSQRNTSKTLWTCLSRHFLAGYQRLSNTLSLLPSCFALLFLFFHKTILL